MSMNSSRIEKRLHFVPPAEHLTNEAQRAFAKGSYKRINTCGNGRMEYWKNGSKDIKALTWDALSLNPVFHYSTIPLFRYGWACKDIIPSSRETKCLHDVHIELTIFTFYSNCIQVFLFY